MKSSTPVYAFVTMAGNVQNILERGGPRKGTVQCLNCGALADYSVDGRIIRLECMNKCHGRHAVLFEIATP